MTAAPVILGPEASIAEALASVRRQDISPATAAVVYVCRPPLETPTGKYLGIVHIQRLLREPRLRLDEIGLRHVRVRARHAVGELRVVREEEQAARVQVEPAHRIETAHVGRRQVDDRAPLAGVALFLLVVGDKRTGYPARPPGTLHRVTPTACRAARR